MIVPIVIVAAIAAAVAVNKKEKPPELPAITFHSTQMAIDKDSERFYVRNSSEVESLTPKTWGGKGAVMAGTDKIESDGALVKEGDASVVEENEALLVVAGETELIQKVPTSDSPFRIYFSVASSDISGEQVKGFKELLVFAEAEGVKDLHVTGFTSPDGSYAFNEKLAEARAKVVKKFIEDHSDGFNIKVTAHTEIGSFFKEKVAEVYAK